MYPSISHTGTTALDIAPGTSMGEVLSMYGIPCKAESFDHVGGRTSIWVYSSKADASGPVIWFDEEQKVRFIEQ